jgi:hypothetical protein
MRAVSEGHGEVVPAVSDEDIQEIEERFGLTFDKSRREILRSNESFDIQACPGSGKTTLLVAKLAILAKKWPHPRRGICVLSHTNVARQEIEEKLSGTGVGERLLAYPHFVGTIHGFVNEFFALPLLRSEGRLTRRIDDDACFTWMKKRLLSTPIRFGLGALVHQERTFGNHIRSLVCDGDVASLIAPAGLSERQWRTLSGVKSAAITQGFYYHSDMFAVAERLLKTQPDIIDLAFWRFPVVFIDEMQDTSEYQGRLLAKIFPFSKCTLRQRFGDSNQAIFEHGQARATTDSFPGPEARGIVNSQRFGQSIASKAQALAPDQPQSHLIGEGPPKTCFPGVSDQESMPHTVFLFKTESLQHVLPAFAQLLLAVFPAEARRSDRFLARAIGFVGRSKEETGEQEEKIPRSLRDYWPKYEPRVARAEPRPEKLADFVHLAQRQRTTSIDCSASIATAVRGIVQLVELVVPTFDSGSVRGLKGLRELLMTDQPALRALESLLWHWCVEAVPLNEVDWPPQLRELRKALTPVLGNRKTEEARAFCEWSTVFGEDTVSGTSGQRGVPNRYRFSQQAASVEVDVGTIHSAKGQTHTATLVLETFSYKHDIGDLLDWLAGDKRGVGKNIPVQRLDRLRLIYTAMTRPTHLLCLAMREQALETKRDRGATIEALQSRGWQIKFL